ncbi:MAG: ABC transporter substrate-binding protein [Candidatus Latescibacteria bacterium]|nr:ABC transporter substrate-binding protein [Candidatus Latescibacterota bacterium]
MCSSCAREARPNDGRVRLSCWVMWTGIEYDAMRRVVDAFNASQNRIVVDLLSVSDIKRKTLIAIAGGDPPDVAGLETIDIPAYASKRALTPLDDHLRAAGLTRDRYIGLMWDSCVYHDRIWALPTVPNTLALYWNKTMFAEAGLDPDRPPRTLAELDEYAEQLTRRDEQGRLVRMGFLPNRAPGPGLWVYFFGGRLWDGVSRVTTTEPANLRAYRWYQSYARRYGQEALQSFQSGFGNYQSPQNYFLAGRVGMVLDGAWLVNMMRAYAASQFRWGVAPFPAAADSLQAVTNANADVLVIPAGVRHPAESFEFVAFVSSQPMLERLCTGMTGPTPLKTVSPAFLARHPHPNIRLFIDLTNSPRAFIAPQMPNWKEYQAELTDAVEQVWLLQATPEAAFAGVQARVQRSLDRELRHEARLAAGERP